MTGKKVVLFGTGDFAQVASVYLAKDSLHEVTAFTVHDAYRTDSELLGKPVVSFEQLTELYPPGVFALFIDHGIQPTQQGTGRSVRGLQGERL